MKSAEGSGRTVEEAIRDALRTLGARREDVDLIVLDEGSRGMLGLGSRSARVRLTLLSEMEEEGDTAVAEPPAPVRMATEEAREFAELGPIVETVKTYRGVVAEIDGLEALLAALARRADDRHGVAGIAQGGRLLPHAAVKRAGEILDEKEYAPWRAHFPDAG